MNACRLCERKVHAHGLCHPHYMRERRLGDAAAPVNYFRDPMAAFEARCRPLENGCIEWTGATVKGHGVLRVKGVLVYAHRFAFERLHGRPIAPGMELHHVCRLRRCVNGEHVEEKTKAEHGAIHSRERWAS